ncbi:MAG: DUF6744 family protein [Vampirovibrionia bacterium]
MPKKVKKDAIPVVAKKTSVDTCGFLTWWEFSGFKSTPADLRAVLKDHNYEIDVPDILHGSALSKSIRDYRFSTSNRRFKTERAYQDDKEVVINILERMKVNDKKVEWHHVDTLVWEVDPKDFLSKGSSADEGVQKACTHFLDDYRDNSTYIDHGFLRPNVLQSELLKINAVSLRSRGGIYFIDSSKAKDIEKLNALCEDLNGITLCLCTMNNDANTQKSIAGQVHSSFSERLKILEDKTTQWKDRTRSLRKDTMADTLQEFTEIRNSLEVYKNSLNMKADDLFVSLQEIEQIANDLILDQATTDRGVSSSTIKRWNVIMESNGGSGLSDYKIPIPYLKSLALPDCHYQERFYKASTNSSAYRALVHIGYVACLDISNDILELSKI